MKKIKILTVTLIILFVTMIALFGIFVPKQNRMENIVRDYEYAMDLKGGRNIRLTVDTTTNTVIKDADGNEVTDAGDLTDEELATQGYTKEEVAVNAQEILMEENYQASKEILENRLQKLGVTNYIIKLDEQTGDILIEIPENDLTDSIISNLGSTGKFEIVDTETQEVLMNNQDIKLANVMYGSGGTQGTVVYLNIEFTKDGTKKLEEISGKYVASTDTTTEENTENTENTETTEKTITMKIDDEDIMTTSFDETIKTGRMQLSIGNGSTDQETLQEYIGQANSMAVVLDSGNLPIQYTVDENQYILSDITENELAIAAYVFTAIVVIALLVLIIRYRSAGALGAVSYLGLISLFLIIIRYTNVVLSLEGIFGIALICIINYIFIYKLLENLKKEEKEQTTVLNRIKETYRDIFFKIIPVAIAGITFCFIAWEPISSFGMVMFWGIAMIAIYNITVTNFLFKIKNEK